MQSKDHLSAADSVAPFGSEVLEPCPFCNLSHGLKVTSAQELAQEGEDDPEPWLHSDSYAVMCDASRPNGPGGCGASGGFFPTTAEAIAAWNRRASPSPSGSGPTDEVPAILFDGFAVLSALDERAKARTSHENVSDVLDAVVRLLRAAIQSKGNQHG